jgi:spore maturation protein CgeB
MKLVIFGLAVSSSWGNGHAVLWRALIRAFARRGHQTVFFERDTPYYAQHRDLTDLEGGRLVLYKSWDDVLPFAKRELADADAGMVTSYCPDALGATALVLEAPCLHVFYDLDTPVTLAQLAAGQAVGYIAPDGLSPFDLVLSYTGGAALHALRQQLGARRIAPLYGSVDPNHYRPALLPGAPRAALSHLGTYSDDRQAALEVLFIEPARRWPHAHFVIGGSQPLPMEPKHPVLAPRRLERSSEVLRIRTMHAQCHPTGNGSLRMVPIGASFRSGCVRNANSQRLVGSTRRVFRT